MLSSSSQLCGWGTRRYLSWLQSSDCLLCMPLILGGHPLLWCGTYFRLSSGIEFFQASTHRSMSATTSSRKPIPSAANRSPLNSRPLSPENVTTIGLAIGMRLSLLLVSALVLLLYRERKRRLNPENMTQRKHEIRGQQEPDGRGRSTNIRSHEIQDTQNRPAELQSQEVYEIQVRTRSQGDLQVLHTST